MDATKQAILAEAFGDIVGSDSVLINEPMANHTTFKIGGPAQLLVQPHSIPEIQAILALCRNAQVPVHVMGLGSNILVADAGMPNVVVKLAENFSDITVTGCTITAQAGASNEAVAKAAQNAALAGYEFASGIPGSIGGAAIMNAGAYGGEFKDVASEVTCLTPEGDIVTVSADEAQWSYRHSMMMDAGYLVLGATLKLTADDAADIQERMDDLRARREEKQPLEMPSAGSTFKRPEGYFAGKLIQDAGLKGFKIGGAQVSPKHSGFVVNAGGATAQDVCDLIAHIQNAVMANEGVAMEPEVRMWGFDHE
ncbi:MAG: UDP-N-acetylmuramate dehydrogenase [Eggerthellales bacterium]|nr:UDP-N-acetylmuramate dehydrogenase [Eggerthellales bacterium]